MKAQDLILEADKIRRDQGITQREWCRRAGMDEYGKLVSNAFRKGNCKVDALCKLLKPLGYELKIVKAEDAE